MLRRSKQARGLKNLKIVQSITDAALTHLGLDELLHELLGRIRTILAADTATALLLTEDGAYLTPHASSGLEEEVASGIRIPLGRGVAGTIAARKTPILIEDLSRSSAWSPILKRKVRSLAGLPLQVEGRVVGVLHVGSFSRRRFTRQDLHVLELVSHRLALAIDRARLYEEVLAGREALRALSRRLVEAQEVERRRIACELHDEVGQTLTGLKLMLATRGDPHVRKPEMMRLINESMSRVRDLSMQLRPTMLDDLGLLPALLWHVERVAAQTAVKVDFRHALVERRFRPEVETAAFRIVQEALTNVVRHAGVAEAKVSIWAERDALGIEIEDRGVGFDPAQAFARSPVGLTGMRERVHLLGGRIVITSTPGGGTRVLAELPLSPPDGVTP